MQDKIITARNITFVLMNGLPSIYKDVLEVFMLQQRNPEVCFFSRMFVRTAIL